VQEGVVKTKRKRTRTKTKDYKRKSRRLARLWTGGEIGKMADDPKKEKEAHLSLY